MACLPACNPAVPFLGRIPKPLQIGNKIKISGMMTHGGDNRFTINLQTGPATCPRDDAGLHLSIRPNENTIVRNNYQNKCWGAEERNCHCPIAPGRSYDIDIEVRADCFSVSVNGAHYCDFRYRTLRFDCIHYVSVEGQTTLRNVDVHQHHHHHHHHPHHPPHHHHH